jgi:release factor glutamine methyltransferase
VRGIDSKARHALLHLGRHLKERGYRFVTVTPETHRRVNERATLSASDGGWRDAFGWNRPFAPNLLPDGLLSALLDADLLFGDGPWLRARVRFSSLGDKLYAHSAYPTLEKDAVFFGPDTYRFCAFVKRSVARVESESKSECQCVVDVGCGSGAGGLSLAGRARDIILSDISARALAFAEVNAELAGVRVTLRQSDVLQDIERSPDLVIANPPYLRDPLARSYRDGGGQYGEALAVRITKEALLRLSPRGRLLLYSGSAIVGGRDTLLAALEPTLAAAPATFTYEELDPDVFGEELELPHYAGVDRLAAVGLELTLG